MNAMLLCAGLGTRFRPTTDKLAKPVLPFLNIPLLGYPLADLEKLPLKNLVLNTHHLPKTIEPVVSQLTQGRSYKVHFSPENPILGSGGGIKAAQKYLEDGDDFIVGNGDEVILLAHDKGYAPLIEFHKKSGALATLLTTNHPEAGRSLGGVWADGDHRITKIGEKNSKQADSAQHFAGIFIFSPRVFKFMPSTGGEFHIFKDCLLPAIQSGEKVMAFRDTEMLWLEMTDLKFYLAATRLALEQMSKKTVYAGQLLSTLERFGQKMNRVSDRQWLGEQAKFSGQLDEQTYLFMGAKSEISSGVEIKDFAVMGYGSRFNQGYIESSVIASQIGINEMVSLRRQLLI